MEDCEEAVRREAARQAQQWITRRVEELAKKKKTVRALLEIIPPEEGIEIGEIEAELARL